MIYRCCDQRRRDRVNGHATLNGIDWLEVLDGDAPAGSPRQRTLLLHCLKDVPNLDRTNVRIEGGDRVRPVSVEWADDAAGALAQATLAEKAHFTALLDKTRVLVVRTDSTGDYSPYLLRLVESPIDPQPPQGFDPRLSEVEFSFKVECPSPFDCAPVEECPREPADEPDLDYLARDYASFRRLLLDRLSRLVPGWHERTPADFGVALAELLAYAGDHLSYQQDAVATEAYLQTARRRVSLRRHARLVDYRMHDGCNARAWVQLNVKQRANVRITPDNARFYTRLPGLPARIVPGSREDRQALERRPEVFEPVYEERLHGAHNRILLYTWGDRSCCLPRGSTRATLDGHFPRLKAGHALVFVEEKGPRTGDPADADPAHRHVVRLTDVRHTGPGGRPLADPLDGHPITEIAWDAEDAFPFPLCVSATLDDDTFVDEVSAAWGNVVLVDHGMTLPDPEPLGAVPGPRLYWAPRPSPDACAHPDPVPIPPRFRPRLARAPLTQQGPRQVPLWRNGTRTRVELRHAPAARAMRWQMGEVLPGLRVFETSAAPPFGWEVRRDLLSSAAIDRALVVEVEEGGAAFLRFGDDVHGMRPDEGAVFEARYRVGNGLAGNVGAETLVHVAAADARIVSARNPLAARGGAEPETAEEVRRRAPQAFRTQERAVTEEDYAEVAGRHPAVQRAAATLRWTGSWHTVFVTVDRAGGLPVDPAFEAEAVDHLERYRMAGHDLEVDAPRFVPLEVELLVCVADGYLRGEVQRALLEVLGSRTLPDGRQGLFHPDLLTFGQTLYLSPLYAAARRVPGVGSVEVRKFQRQGMDDPRWLQAGKMALGRLEIARLDNDPNFPERGVLRLTLHGGR